MTNDGGRDASDFRLEGRSLIGGWPVEAGTVEAVDLRGVDATTGAPLSPVYRSATSEQIDQAVHLAAAAFETYRDVPGERRAAFLRAIAQRIESIVDRLVERAGAETALPEARVRGETARTTNQLRLFADLIEEGSWVDARIDPALPDRKPLPRPDLRSMLRPIGPVAVFGASNFPLAFSVAGGDTASALAAGCPVVVKAHPAHPGTSELAGRAIALAARDEGMPDGVFALLFDASIEVGSALVRHPLIRAVAFTGSLRAGRALHDLVAAREEPIPIFAEMGSVNPVFLLPGALAGRGEQIARDLHQSVTLGFGQLCTKPGIVLTDGHDGFRECFVQLMRDTVPAPMLSSGIAAAYARGADRLGGSGGVGTLVARRDLEAHRASAALFETDAASLVASPELAEEVFGPGALLVRYRTREDLLAVARSLPGQLTVTVHGTEQDLIEAADLLAILETRAGRLVFNQFPTGVEVGHAMVHGGPYPATTDPRATSVGSAAILRFARPVCYQNFPDAALPKALQAANPLGLRRLVDGRPEERG